MADVIERALALQRRAAALGFDWPDVQGVLDKLDEEREELAEALSQSAERQRHELGDVLLTVINLARHLDVDPAAALEAANERFRRRFAQVEAVADALPPLGDAGRLEAMERVWVKAKQRES
jgi:nucleoside triphosphate diphosphatase